MLFYHYFREKAIKKIRLKIKKQLLFGQK